MIVVAHNGGSLWGNITHGIEHVVSNPVFKAVAPILLNAGVSVATENPSGSWNDCGKCLFGCGKC